ncbi:MAG TPA: RDD family protein [Candidatus Omnitrophota bacterium]|nr:RDD family protein [Candidatus Omnitrophota bacterium]HPS37022.1 RDD family protein [Candidatus Omnitrophota bacterium]
MNEANLPLDNNYKKLGSLWQRFCSSLLDGVIVGIPFLGIIYLVMRAMNIDPASDRAQWPVAFTLYAAAILYILPGIYNVWLMGRYGMTLGQRAVGLKTVREDGRSVGYPVALGRYLFSILYGIGFLMIGTLLTIISAVMIVKDPKKQTLHDKVCKTLVLSQS